MNRFIALALVAAVLLSGADALKKGKKGGAGGGKKGGSSRGSCSLSSGTYAVFLSEQTFSSTTTDGGSAHLTVSVDSSSMRCSIRGIYITDAGALATVAAGTEVGGNCFYTESDSLVSQAKTYVFEFVNEAASTPLTFALQCQDGEWVAQAGDVSGSGLNAYGFATKLSSSQENWDAAVPKLGDTEWLCQQRTAPGATSGGAASLNGIAEYIFDGSDVSGSCAYRFTTTLDTTTIRAGTLSGAVVQACSYLGISTATSFSGSILAYQAMTVSPNAGEHVTDSTMTRAHGLVFFSLGSDRMVALATQPTYAVVQVCDRV